MEAIPYIRIPLKINTQFAVFPEQLCAGVSHDSSLFQWTADILRFKAEHRIRCESFRKGPRLLSAPLMFFVQKFLISQMERQRSKVIYPVHPNLAVSNVAKEIVNCGEQVRLAGQSDIVDFHDYFSKTGTKYQVMFATYYDL